MFKRTIFALSLLIAAAPAYADDEESRWSGKVAFGYLATSGNTENLAVEAGDKNTYLESKTAVSAKPVGNLALVASYTVKHNTDVLPITEKTDTYTALSLEFVW